MDDNRELYILTVPEGVVTFRIPKNLSPESAGDIDELLTLVMRRLKRLAAATERLNPLEEPD